MLQPCSARRRLSATGTGQRRVRESRTPCRSQAGCPPVKFEVDSVLIVAGFESVSPRARPSPLQWAIPSVTNRPSSGSVRRSWECRSMVCSVKQLTEGFCCITAWHRSGFTSAFAPGEQKKLKRLPLNQRVLGSSLRGLTTPGRNGGESYRSLFVLPHAQRIEASPIHCVAPYPPLALSTKRDVKPPGLSYGDEPSPPRRRLFQLATGEKEWSGKAA